MIADRCNNRRMVSCHHRGYRAGFTRHVDLYLLDVCLVKYINGMRCGIKACDPCITHNGDPGAYFFLRHCSFVCECKTMVAAHLVAHFMCYIVYIEIISHRNSIGRRSDAASFLSVHANTTNTAGISTTAGSAEHVANIVISLPDVCSQSSLQFRIPVREGCIGIRCGVIINNCCSVRYEVEVDGQVFFKDTVATGKCCIKGGQNQSNLARVEGTKKVRVLTIT